MLVSVCTFDVWSTDFKSSGVLQGLELFVDFELLILHSSTKHIFLLCVHRIMKQKLSLVTHIPLSERTQEQLAQLFVNWGLVPYIGTPNLGMAVRSQTRLYHNHGI